MILLFAMMSVPNFHNVRCEYLLVKLNTQTDTLDQLTPGPVQESEPITKTKTGPIFAMPTILSITHKVYLNYIKLS